MLPSVELFICLRVAHREAFWEELSKLTWRGRSIQRPLLFWVPVHVIFFHSLPSRVGCCFQCKLFSIFKLLCLVLSIFFTAQPSRTVYSLLLHLNLREKISSPIQDLFCSRKPLTYPGLPSVQCGLHGRTEYPLLQALTFFTQTSRGQMS